jgi:drug/metabolite transporter (DMT)-like permease
VVGIILVVFASFLWALDTLIRYPLVEKGINPLNIVFFEHIILTLLFGLPIIANIKRIGEFRLGDLFYFLFVGAIGSAFATVCFTESFQYLNPSLVILLQKLQPIVAIILAAIFLKEQIQPAFLFWAAVCLFGGYLVSAPDIARFYNLVVQDFSKVSSDSALHGYALVGISIIGWGATTVFGKKLTIQGYSSKDIMGGRFMIGMLAMIPFVKWNTGMFFSDPTDYLRLVVMVLISGALAMYLYYQGLNKISAKSCAIAEMFFPFFAVIANWVFLGKQLSEVQLAGGALLILGSLVIQLKKY